MLNARGRFAASAGGKKASVASARRQARVIRTRASVNQAVEKLAKKVGSKLSLAGAAAGAQLLLVLPALAEEAAKEPGKLFDFDVTLPIMAVQFLVLMKFLEASWFNPVGKVLDERDENLRNILSGVQDNSSDVKKYEDEASKLVSDARQEAANMITEAKKSA